MTEVAKRVEILKQMKKIEGGVTSESFVLGEMKSEWVIRGLLCAVFLFSCFVDYFI